MPLTYSVGAKNARMTATRDLCADGSLEFLTSADAVLASIGLSTTGGTVTGGVWTLAFDGSATASAAGTAARARIKNSSGTVVVSGLAVALPPPQGQAQAADTMTLNNTDLQAGQTIDLNSVTITHA